MQLPSSHPGLTHRLRAGSRALLRTLLALAGACLLGCTPGAAADPVQIPGSQVSLVPPAGMELATQFSGLTGEQGQASILVAELPAEAAEPISTLFGSLPAARTAFASKGIVVDTLAHIQAQGAKVPVVAGTQRAHGQSFRKWAAFYRGANAVLVTVQLPDGSPITDAQVMHTLASVTLQGEVTLATKLAALPFTAEPAGPFRIIDALGGSSLRMTAGPLDVDPQGLQPLIVIASQLALPAGATSPATTSRTLIAGTRELDQGVAQSQRSVSFAGIDGIVVTGTLPEGRRFAHYLALWPGQRYVRMAVIYPADADPDLEQNVAAIAASVMFRP